MLYVFIVFLKYCAKILYFFMKLLPTQNKVVLISRFNSEASLDFQLLENEINSRNNNIKVVILNHKLRTRALIIVDVLIEMYHLATSKYCIVDSYIISVSILNHKRKLKVIQIWHAMGAIKKFGHAALGTKEGASHKMARIMCMHKNYDFIIAGGMATIPYYAEAFNVDTSIIKPYGLPRINYLLDNNNQNCIKEKIYEKYPELQNKKNILYIPTFRKNGNVHYENIINEVDYNKYNLIIKQHYLDKFTIKNLDKSLLEEHFSVFEMLMVADYVITDYSAVIFEAIVLNIPLYFYTYDVKKYIKRRGLFINFNQSTLLPGYYSESSKEIIKAIENNQVNYEEIKQFKEEYITTENDNIAAKIINLFNLGGDNYEQ